MEITRKDLNACTAFFTIQPTAEELKGGLDQAYRQFAKNISVPGFRPGAAPKRLIEERVPKESAQEAALEILVQRGVKKATEGLNPYGQSHVDIVEANFDTDTVKFTVKVPLQPIVELGEYNGIEAVRPPIEPNEEEIQQAIEHLRGQKSKRQAVTDRGVELGDIAIVSIRPDEIEGDGRTFMTVAGKTFPQLDEALVGMKPEDVKHLELSFPETFEEKDWAGKTLGSTVMLKSLSSVSTPEIDDEFAKSLQLENVEMLRERVIDMIRNAKANSAKQYISQQLYDAVLKLSKVDVPDTMWESVASQRLTDFRQEAAKKNQEFEEYVKQNGMTVEEFIQHLKNEAKSEVMRAVIVHEIFRKENMELNDRDLTTELIAMAQEYETTPDKMMVMLRKSKAFEELRFRAIYDKVTAFLYENAKFQEPIEA